MREEATLNYSGDDIFALGNIALLAVMKGLGEQALPILKFIQKVRPDNAGSFLLEAMHIYAVDSSESSIQFLENSGALQAEINRDETLAFHLYLLQQTGKIQHAYDLGCIYLNEALIQSETAREAIGKVVLECEDELNF